MFNDEIRGYPTDWDMDGGLGYIEEPQEDDYPVGKPYEDDYPAHEPEERLNPDIEEKPKSLDLAAILLAHNPVYNHDGTTMQPDGAAPEEATTMQPDGAAPEEATIMQLCETAPETKEGEAEEPDEIMLAAELAPLIACGYIDLPEDKDEARAMLKELNELALATAGAIDKAEAERKDYEAEVSADLPETEPTTEEAEEAARAAKEEAERAEAAKKLKQQEAILKSQIDLKFKVQDPKHGFNERYKFRLRAHLNDRWNADLFLREYKKQIRYRREVPNGGIQGWVVWNGKYWQMNASHTVVEYFSTLPPRLKGHAAWLVYSIRNDEKVQKAVAQLLYDHIKGMGDRKNILNALSLASAHEAVNMESSGFDPNPNLLNVANGIIDFEHHTIRPHNPKDLITKFIDIPFEGFSAAPPCPRWEQFVDEIMCGDVELMDYLQRAAGYSATGNTEEEIMFVLYGNGANGKSLFLRVLHDILGDYARQGATDMLTNMATPDSDRANVSIANLRGARFVAISETRQNARLQENLVKQLTGNDPITARNMYENFSTFKPHFKLWLATNHKPVIGDTGLGMWRRLKLIPFKATFSLEQQDPKLYDKLMAEKEGILAWLIRGEAMRQERPLKTYEAEAVTLSTLAYRSEMDKIQMFIDECMVEPKTPEEFISVNKCYKIYEEWCKNAGEKPNSMRYLALRLQDKGYERIKRGRNGDRYWNKLAENPERDC